jgi:hypothetical protein
MSSEADPALFVRGFGEAHERLLSRLESIETPPDDVFLPLFESLNWAVALCDLATDKKITLNADADDLRGLRFVRNRVHHQWENAVAVSDTVLFPAVRQAGRGGSRINAPPVVSAWAWLPAAKLPPPGDYADLDGEVAYVRRLENQFVSAVLSRFSEKLTSLR